MLRGNRGVLAVSNKGPIIIVGAGRSGSTLLHRMLCKHPNFAWLPGAVCRRFPKNPGLYRLFMRGLDYPILGRQLEKIGPGECYRFWEYHCKGFSAPYRDLVAGDVTEGTKGRIRDAMSKIPTQKRYRLLIKITGWPRIGFLSEIFKDAKFIHMMRDGRAVANSLLHVYFWTGWKGPENWGWGQLSPAQQEEWDRYEQSFAVLAAIHWKLLMDSMENAKTLVSGENFLELKYEQLCSDPLGALGKVTEFCHLDWTGDFERKLATLQVRNTNYKFQRDLTAEQQSDVEEVLGDYLRRYGYL
jgi:sulfotransferase family protein